MTSFHSVAPARPVTALLSPSWLLAAGGRDDAGAVATPAPGDRPASPSLAESLRPRPVVSSPLGMVVTSAPEASWAGVRMLESGRERRRRRRRRGLRADGRRPGRLRPRRPDVDGDPPGDGRGAGRLLPGARAAADRPRESRRRARREPTSGDRWPPRSRRRSRRSTHALRRYGTKSFAEVLAPGDRGGRVGLPHPVVRARVTSATTPGASSTPRSSTRVYLTGPTGESGIPDPAPIGTCVKIPGLADTLRRLAEAGPSDFYTGDDRRAARRGRCGPRAASSSRSDLARVPGERRRHGPVRGAYRGLTVLVGPVARRGERPRHGPADPRRAPVRDARRGRGSARGHAIVEAVRLARAEAAAPALRATDVDRRARSCRSGSRKPWAARQAARIRPGRALARRRAAEGRAPAVRGTGDVARLGRRRAGERRLPDPEPRALLRRRLGAAEPRVPPERVRRVVRFGRPGFARRTSGRARLAVVPSRRSSSSATAGPSSSRASAAAAGSRRCSSTSSPASSTGASRRTTPTRARASSGRTTRAGPRVMLEVAPPMPPRRRRGPEGDGLRERLRADGARPRLDRLRRRQRRGWDPATSTWEGSSTRGAASSPPRPGAPPVGSSGPAARRPRRVSARAPRRASGAPASPPRPAPSPRGRRGAGGRARWPGAGPRSRGPSSGRSRGPSAGA